MLVRMTHVGHDSSMVAALLGTAQIAGPLSHVSAIAGLCTVHRQGQKSNVMCCVSSCRAPQKIWWRISSGLSLVWSIAILKGTVSLASPRLDSSPSYLHRCSVFPPSPVLYVFPLHRRAYVLACMGSHTCSVNGTVERRSTTLECRSQFF